MERVVIAVDIDGTLRCNCTETCRDSNQRIVDLTKTLASFKNTKVMVWSAGGADYAREFAELFGIGDVWCGSKLDPSTWKWGAPDIAIDDMHEASFGKFNLVVHEK